MMLKSRPPSHLVRSDSYGTLHILSHELIGEVKGSGGFGIGVELTAIGADASLVHEAHTVRFKAH